MKLKKPLNSNNTNIDIWNIFILEISHPPRSCWQGSFFQGSYGSIQKSVKSRTWVLAKCRQHVVMYSKYSVYTDHLLDICKNGCQHKTLRAKVDNTEKQSVKDQQRGLVSIKQHITEGVGFICGGTHKNLSCTRTITQLHIWVSKHKYPNVGVAAGSHYRCRRCFFQWVPETPFLWPSQT